MLTTDVAGSKLMGPEHQNEASLLPNDEDIAWAEEFLDSLSPEVHEILRSPTRRMLSL
jgi:hypothetical protein